MTLEPDFEDFISLLNQHQVEYLVVGGYAMAFHQLESVTKGNIVK